MEIYTYSKILGVKAELCEWFDEGWYDRFVHEVAPGVRVRPLGGVNVLSG